MPIIIDPCNSDVDLHGIHSEMLTDEGINRKIISINQKSDIEHQSSSEDNEQNDIESDSVLPSIRQISLETCDNSVVQRDKEDCRTSNRITHACRTCRIKFGCIMKLKRHEAMHEYSTLIHCLHCSTVFRNQKLLQKHVSHAHSKKKHEIYHCRSRSHVSFSQNALKQHQELDHLEGRSFKCTYEKCTSAFAVKFDLIHHIAVVHDISKHKYKCEFCERTFLHKTKYEIHRYSHDKSLSPHMCNNCNKRFSTADALQGHIASKHENNRPFKCKHCNKAYAKKYALLQHARRHTGEKVSKCQLCEEMFENASLRRQHMKDAHGVGFSCIVCGNMYVSQYKLNYHMQHQHVQSKKPLTLICNVCKQKMSTTNELQQHLITFHNVNQPKNSDVGETSEHVMSEGSNLDTGQQIILVESSEIENALQSNHNMTTVVYFGPSDGECGNIEIITTTEDDIAQQMSSVVMTTLDENIEQTRQVEHSISTLNINMQKQKELNTEHVKMTERNHTETVEQYLNTLRPA
ncbi:uncharacterized protein LOC102809430 [Saccoglossus kowalevskii]